MKNIEPLAPQAAHIGIAYNVQDMDNFDFLYVRFHASTFATGAVTNGSVVFKSPAPSPRYGQTPLASVVWHKVKKGSTSNKKLKKRIFKLQSNILKVVSYCRSSKWIISKNGHQLLKHMTIMCGVAKGSQFTSGSIRINM